MNIEELIKKREDRIEYYMSEWMSKWIDDAQEILEDLKQLRDISKWLKDIQEWNTTEIPDDCEDPVWFILDQEPDRNTDDNNVKKCNWDEKKHWMKCPYCKASR